MKTIEISSNPYGVGNLRNFKMFIFLNAENKYGDLIEADNLIESCSKYIHTPMSEISLVPTAGYQRNFAGCYDPIESDAIHRQTDSP